MLLFIIPSFRAAPLGAPGTMTHQVQTRFFRSNQRLEQRVDARISHWSTLVAFEWLDRKLSLIECQITICT